MFFILRLSLIFYTFHAVSVFKEGKCRLLFKGTAKEQIEFEIRSLGVKKFIKEYKGQEGSIQLSKKLKVSRMDYIYKLVSQSLTRRQMSQLKWQQFQGTTEEFSKLRNLLNREGEWKKIIGKKGYVNFADEYFAGKMPEAFINVSAVLDKGKMAQLGWQVFQGTTKEFYQLSGWILNEKEELIKEYLGMDGYAKFVDKYFEGNMFKAFTNVSAVLDKGKMAQLGWQLFLGTTKEFSKLRGWILNEKEELIKEYLGMDGYAKFVDKYFEGNMFKAFINVSAVLDKGKMAQLAGKHF